MKRVISFFILFSLCAALLSCTKAQNNKSIVKNTFGLTKNRSEPKQGVHLLLYFPGNDYKYLIPEERLVPIDGTIEKTIVEEVVKGSYINKKPQSWLRGVRVISLSGNNNTLTINLSREFIKSFTGNKVSNEYMIYSIVNSLTELPGVKNIIFLSEGKPIGIIGGIDFSKAFVRNRRLFNRDYNIKPNEVLQKEMNFERSGKWLNAYLLMSDDENNRNRKYYEAYLQEMQEMKENGFLNTDFKVGNYVIDNTGKKARVEVKFNVNNVDNTKQNVNSAYFNTVKIENAWMVDWLTEQ